MIRSALTLLLVFASVLPAVAQHHVTAKHQYGVVYSPGLPYTKANNACHGSKAKPNWDFQLCDTQGGV